MSLDDALAVEVPADLDASARYVRDIHAVIVATDKKSFRLARRIGEVVKAHREATPHANTKGVAQSWEDRCNVTFGFTARCGSNYKALLAIPEGTDISLRDAYIKVGVYKIGGADEAETGNNYKDPVAADTTSEGDETGGRAASESATEPTGAEMQDPVEQKAEELRQQVENFYGLPKDIRKTFQEFLELTLRDPNRNDPDGRDGIEIARLADDFTRTMLATRDEIQPHTEQVWNQLAVHFPGARAALSGEQRAHENAVQPPEMKTTGGAK